MIEFTIDKKTYTIKDLTIGQYYRIQNFLVTESLASNLVIISELSSCPQEELRKLDNYQFNVLWDKFYEDLTKAHSDNQLYKEIEINGNKYYFIDISKLTVGEMVDMDVMSADPNKEKLLHKMMAVLYRPAKRNWFKVEAEDYDSNTLDQRAEIFLDMPVKYVFGAIRFFLQVPSSLLKTTLDSLAKETKTKTEKEFYANLSQITSELLETGSELSPSSLETILPKFQKLNEAMLSQLSTGLPTERTNSEKKKSKFANFVPSMRQK